MLIWSLEKEVALSTRNVHDVLTLHRTESGPRHYESFVKALSAWRVARQGWETVQRALMDPRWTYRTIDGISRDTELSYEEVAGLLKQHRSEVRVAPIRDGDGRVLYTSKRRRRSWRSVLWEIQACLSKSI